MKKQNIILTISILAPVLLIGFFIATAILQTRNIADPTYNILFKSYEYGSEETETDIKLIPRIIDNHLVFIKHKDKHKAEAEAEAEVDYNYGHLKLYMYDLNEKKLKELSFDQEDLAPIVYKNKTFYVAKELQHLKLSKEDSSPDGYKFESSSGGGDLFFPLFSYRDYAPTLEKAGKREKLKIKDRDIYRLTFIGWILEK